ncbi:hypothetical protein DPMN_091976 [Dreissena polymorpha]|uniref:Peptidase S1 domain-containing protein n=1 Tax=Dreissena polymorpha TaxID=45954 RepID=A0A9D4L1D4_DREPO|nr:hypothetical protein DPMN_091976 [Dreissena polymorpha]
MVCAADYKRGVHPCHGDSGGPLVCNIAGRYYVMGAPSFTVGCGSTEHPSVFARVTSVRSWIDSISRCYSSDSICDHVQDCPGNEDESGCVCQKMYRETNLRVFSFCVQSTRKKMPSRKFNIHETCSS